MPRVPGPHPDDCPCELCAELRVAAAADERRRAVNRAAMDRYRRRQRGEDVPLLVAAATPINHTCDGSAKKTCACRRRRAREQTTPERNRRRLLKRHYGLTLEQYDALYRAQAGRCAICGRHEDEVRWGPEGASGLVVDHRHSESGEVRGLLCLHCNTGVGCFGDDPDRLEAAARWLRSVNPLQVAVIQQEVPADPVDGAQVDGDLAGVLRPADQ